MNELLQQYSMRGLLRALLVFAIVMLPNILFFAIANILIK